MIQTSGRSGSLARFVAYTIDTWSGGEGARLVAVQLESEVCPLVGAARGAKGVRGARCA